MSESSGRQAVDQDLLAHSADELYEYGPCGFVSMLPGGIIAQVNHTFLRWTGYPREALVGKRLQDLLTVPGRIYYDTHYAPLLSMQGFVNELAFDIVRADGGVLPILLNSTLKRDQAGKPLLIVTAVFDATDRRSYERELLQTRREAERASRIKADLLSMIGHDIRTPASAIVMALDLLERTTPSPEQEKALRILRSASNNLLALLEEVLDFSKLEAGKITLEETPFDIGLALDELLLTIRPKAEEKGLLLELELDPNLPGTIIADRGKLLQVLSNLLTNAIKFTEQGEVRVSVEVLRHDGDGVKLRFAVSDTGIGIPQDRLPYIFDEFTQASKETGRKYGGTGLGLSICNKLLALYDSHLSVNSREGAGSTFSFELETRAQPGAQSSAASS